MKPNNSGNCVTLLKAVEFCITKSFGFPVLCVYLFRFLLRKPSVLVRMVVYLKPIPDVRQKYTLNKIPVHRRAPYTPLEAV